jgi:hypothetical protein
VLPLESLIRECYREILSVCCNDTLENKIFFWEKFRDLVLNLAMDFLVFRHASGTVRVPAGEEWTKILNKVKI